MKHILSPEFKYTPSHATDIRKTFERVAKEAVKSPVPKEISEKEITRIPLEWVEL